MFNLPPNLSWRDLSGPSIRSLSVESDEREDEREYDRDEITLASGQGAVEDSVAPLPQNGHYGQSARDNSQPGFYQRRCGGDTSPALLTEGQTAAGATSVASKPKGTTAENLTHS